VQASSPPYLSVRLPAILPYLSVRLPVILPYLSVRLPVILPYLSVRLPSCAGKFTAFVNLEDDIRVRWPALVAWAADTAALAPHNLTRGFVRTEVSSIVAIINYTLKIV
jgi:hypothetical protein